MNLAIATPVAHAPMPECAQGMDPLAVLQNPKSFSFSSILKKEALNGPSPATQDLANHSTEDMELVDVLLWSPQPLAKEPDAPKMLTLDLEPQQETQNNEETQEGPAFQEEASAQQIQAPLTISLPQESSPHWAKRGAHKEPKEGSPQPESALVEMDLGKIASAIPQTGSTQTLLHVQQRPQESLAQEAQAPLSFPSQPVLAQGTHALEDFLSKALQLPLEGVVTQQRPLGLLSAHPHIPTPETLEPIRVQNEPESLLASQEEAHSAKAFMLDETVKPSLQEAQGPSPLFASAREQLWAEVQKTYGNAEATPPSLLLGQEGPQRPQAPRKNTILGLTPRKILSPSGTPAPTPAPLDRFLTPKESSVTSINSKRSGDTQRDSQFGTSQHEGQQSMPQNQANAASLNVQQAQGARFGTSSSDVFAQQASAHVQQQLVPAILEHLERQRQNMSQWTRIELPRSPSSGGDSLGVSVRVRNRSIHVLFDAQTQPWNANVIQNWDALQSQAQKAGFSLDAPSFA